MNAPSSNKEWKGEERRASTYLSEEQINEVADRAEKLLEERFYAQIGKSLISKILWICGTALIALSAWLSGTGHIKLGG